MQQSRRSLDARVSEGDAATGPRSPGAVRPAIGNPGNRRTIGFTLIELLVVIFIISILAALITVTVGKAREKAKEAEVRSSINTFDVGLVQYFLDHNIYPGYGNDDIDPEKNSFPALYEALLGDKAPRGGGGKSSPYIELKFDRVVLEDFDREEGEARAVCTNDDRYDRDLEKFYEDPWQGLFIYRECASKKHREDWMINRAKYDIWSCGSDGISESTYGIPDEEEESDDIGNGW